MQTMSVTCQQLYINNPSPRITFFFANTTIKLTNLNKIPNSLSPPHPIASRHVSFHVSPFHLKTHHHYHYYCNHHRQFGLRAHSSATTPQLNSNAHNDSSLNLDAILSLVELLCLFSSTIISLSFAVNYVMSGSKKTLLEAVGSSRALAPVGVIMLVGGMVVGAWMRRRQWWRICREVEEGGGRESVGLNLVGRVEKLEEDLRSSVTIIRVLSRQLEKLGIRFRLTRKALKQPIAEVII